MTAVEPTGRLTSNLRALSVGAVTMLAGIAAAATIRALPLRDLTAPAQPTAIPEPA